MKQNLITNVVQAMLPFLNNAQTERLQEVLQGLCVQIMHIGAFDDEPETVAVMDKYLEENGYVNDFTDGRLHHEIYLSDPRKTAPEKCKTVIRHPIKKV